MTILTKQSIIIKKADATKAPLVFENCDIDNDGEEKVDIIYPPPEPSAPLHYKRRSAGALFCLSVVALLVAVAGVTCGLMLYREYLRSTGVRRYTGFCSIPIVDQQDYGYRSDMLRSDDQLIEPNYHRRVPLRWSPEPDVQIFSVGDEDPAESMANALREEFDVGSRFETIRVYDNGRTVSFIHDFDDNITGIIDADRCFMMDLDPSIVLAPEMLVFGMENGDEFDVTRVRSTLRAVLPALQELAKTAKALTERCMKKPTYRLQQEKGTVIRKRRSADAPSHDYIQFAGKHVQEIEIANLADLLQAEQNARQA